MLENLTHRGAVGADPLMGDGAGVLVQIPDRFFREEMAQAGHRTAAGRPLRRRPLVHAAGRRTARAYRTRSSPRSAQSEGLPLIGFRDVPVDNSSLSKAPDIAAAEPFHRQVFIGRPAEIENDEEYEARLYMLRKVISGRIYAENNEHGHRLLFRVAVGAHHRLQGHVPRLSGRRLLQGSHRSALRDGADPRPPALLDQHLPVVEAGASLSHGRPQWRDQHAARQHQLDGGAPGVGRLRAVRQRHLEAVADLLRRASRTPPASTTRSNSCSRAATRWRTP